MADTDLPISGKDVTIELIANGAPLKVVDKVNSFTESAMTQKLEARHLGTTKVDLDYVPDGWGGEIEVDRNSRVLDDFIDACRAARAARIPFVVVITSTKRFQDGSSVTHTYPECKLDYETRAQRGQFSTIRLPWRCGGERVTT